MTQQQTATTDRVPIRRTTEIEEITNLYIIHPLAARLVPLFARLHFTPNAVSILGMLFGMLAAVAYYHYAEPRFAIAGFLLMVAWHVMDGADGQLARYTRTYSYAGKMLDGISDNVTFAAVYLALATALTHQYGGWIYALVAVAAVCHAIQSANYETQRQEYDYLGWGKKPQEPLARNAPAHDGHQATVLRRLLDVLYRFWFSGLTFASAGVTRKLRATMEPVLQGDAGTAAMARQRYRETIAPQIRHWAILSANYRTLGLFITALFKVPAYYFAFEIVGFSVALAVLVWRLNAAHESLRRQLRAALPTGSVAGQTV